MNLHSGMAERGMKQLEEQDSRLKTARSQDWLPQCAQHGQNLVG
jgi:hypothetical protein